MPAKRDRKALLEHTPISLGNLTSGIFRRCADYHVIPSLNYENPSVCALMRGCQAHVFMEVQSPKVHTLARTASRHSKVTFDHFQGSSTQYRTECILILAIRNYTLNLVTSR